MKLYSGRAATEQLRSQGREGGSTKRGARLQLSAHFTLVHAARLVTLLCNDSRVRRIEKARGAWVHSFCQDSL